MATPQISVSTELMKNYKQTLLMSPEKKFEALQTSTGNSLLFSIGTDNSFYVTAESVGHSTGWQKINLSGAQVAKSFSGQTVTCKTFDAAQSAVDGTIGVAMVINDGTYDHLFLTLGNSNSDLSWLSAPTWVQYPFDNPTGNVLIANVFISETANNTQYIVVDILRNPTDPVPLVSRYYISPATTPVWQPHDVSIDLQADNYTSCLGRQHLPNSPHQPTIDGLYTAGQVDGLPQFTFQPLYNVFNKNIPAPVARLQLPGGLVADSIASCRKSDLSTDLYACSQGGLYYFASSNQLDQAMGVLLVQSPMFNGVRKMYAAQTNNTTVVWGLNENDEIFYVSCPTGQETASPSAWSYPLPIVTQVDLFSPYINRVDDGNTFFAVAGSNLQKLTKSTTSSIWTSQSITLPSPDTADTQKYSSYTTRIQVNDANNQPLVNELVTISSDTRVGVYINHLYYVLDSTGVQIPTDSLGSITVVEWVTGLSGTKLKVVDSGNNTTAINPMNGPMAKIAALNTVDSLKGATITNDDGTTKPLISGNIPDSTLKNVASSNQQLGQVYNTLSSSTGGTGSVRLSSAMAMTAPSAVSVGSLSDIWVDIGDLFRWLASGIEAVIEIVEDAAEKVWHFIATVAGKVYKAVLNVVEEVVAAAEWVFNQIKTAIKDLIQFLEFLFKFNDILITHNVMKNFLLQWNQYNMDSISNLKPQIAAMFTAMQNDVNKWADIPNFDQTPASTTTSNPPLSGQNSAPAQLGVHHFQGNASSASSTLSDATVAEDILKDLLALMEKEGDTLSAACQAIKTDIIEPFNSLTVTQIIQKFIAIIVDTLLQTVENVLLALVDVFVQLMQGLMSFMTAPLDIPVISWLYKELTGNDLSFLDLFCFIAAIPATIVYKLVNNAAPFPENDPFTEGLLNATSFTEFQQVFFTPAAPMAPAAPALALGSGPEVPGIAPVRAFATAGAPAPVLNASRLKVFGVVTGFLALGGTVGLIIVTAMQRAASAAALANAGSVPNPNTPLINDGNAQPQGLVGFATNWPKTLALLGAISNLAYISPNFGTLINSTSANWWQIWNNVLTCISAVKGFINIPLATAEPGSFWPDLSSYVETEINVAWNLPVIINIIENKDNWNTTYKSLIPESIGNFAFNIGGMMDFPITLTTDPKVKFGESVVQYVFMGIYGVMMPIAGGINEWAH